MQTLLLSDEAMDDDDPSGGESGIEVEIVLPCVHTTCCLYVETNAHMGNMEYDVHAFVPCCGDIVLLDYHYRRGFRDGCNGVS